MKRVVITGGTGFIGSWLVKEFLNNNTEVIMLVRSRLSKNDIQICPKLKVIVYNTKEYDDLKIGNNSIDAFYHLAWGGVSTELKNDSILQVDNISFSLRMLEYSSEIGAKRFIGIGTVAEYAFCEGIMDLSAKQTPNDMYGAAKTATHYMLETRARILGIPFNWAVIPSTFGEGRRDNNIITYTITSLLKRERTRYGYLQQMWDFLYVGEVVRALRLIGEKGQENKTYGIGSGVFRPLKDYILAIRDIINPTMELGIGEIPAYSDKVFSSCVSIYDLTKDTGFTPEVSFDEGIRRTIPFYMETLGLCDSD